MPKKTQDPITGATVVAVRPMTSEEANREGWSWGTHGAPQVIVLSTGALIYPSRDDEGNGPGALFGFVPGQGAVRICSKEVGGKR